MATTDLNHLTEKNYVRLALAPGLTVETVTDDDNEMKVLLTKRELAITNGNNRLLKRTQLKLSLNEYIMLKQSLFAVDSVLNYNCIPNIN